MELKDIIESADIVNYISQYVDLEEKNNEFIGLCPFHDEKTPSFTVTPSSGLYYCFGCGCGGNLLTFIQKYHKLNMRDAIEILKEYANITEDLTQESLSATKTIKKYRNLHKDNKKVIHSKLPNDVMSEYENDKDKLKLWADEGIAYDTMEKYQVRYDPFSDRIVFPIRDMTGNIISIKGRTLDPDYKSKKIRKYTYFNSIGDADFLFGYCEHKENIINQNEIIVFEGEKSVMKAESYRVFNSVALMTSHLNPLQLPLFLKLGCRVVFALDKDVDIMADENIKKLKRFLKIEYIKDKSGLLKEKDAPVDLNCEVWNKLYESRYCLN